MDWNRLRSGDNRALNPDHQDVFDMIAEQRAEIERLRELLREGVRKHENYPGGYRALQSEPGLFEYWKRVREALGDD
jgi:hypothetical protein